MISNLCTAALITAAIAFPAFAQTKVEERQTQQPQATASAAASKPTAAKPAKTAASSGVQGHMDKHCSDMHEIMKIKDPKKRQKALDEHKKKMHDEEGCPMMKDGVGDGMGMGMKGGVGK